MRQFAAIPENHRHSATLSLAFLLASLFLIALPAPAWAIEFRSGDDVRVGRNETIDGDLYVAGGQVTIEGRITGDLVAAGGNLQIAGPVEGSVTAAGGDITVSGPVGGSLRLAGGTITISSVVEGDALAAGGNLTTAPGSRLRGDLAIFAGEAALNGPIEGRLTGAGENITLTSEIGEGVSLEVAQLSVGATARIDGDLRYQSANEASIAPAARISGQRIRTDPPEQARAPSSPWDWVPGFFLGWLMPLVLGGILISLWPTASSRLVDQLTARPWLSLLAGLIVLLVTPWLVLLLMITVLGIPAALALLVVYLLALYLSQVVTGLAIGRQLLLLLRREWAGTRGWMLAALAVGLLLLAVLHALPVPVLGFVTTFFSLLLGLGALWLGLTRLHARANQPA